MTQLSQIDDGTAVKWFVLLLMISFIGSNRKLSLIFEARNSLIVQSKVLQVPIFHQVVAISKWITGLPLSRLVRTADFSWGNSIWCALGSHIARSSFASLQVARIETNKLFTSTRMHSHRRYCFVLFSASNLFSDRVHLMARQRNIACSAQVRQK